jgi:hypothetical protein
MQGATSQVSVRLTASTLVGSIQNPASDNFGWRLVDSVIAGRWRTDDVFKSLGTYAFDGAAFCDDGSFTYSTFKKAICGYVDIASTLGGVTAECDSISFGMSVQTFPAKLGPLYSPDNTLSACPPEQDPALDSCEM